MDDLSGRGGAPCGRASLLLRLGRLLDGRGADLHPVVRAPSRISTVTDISSSCCYFSSSSLWPSSALSHIPPSLAFGKKRTAQPGGMASPEWGIRGWRSARMGPYELIRGPRLAPGAINHRKRLGILRDPADHVRAVPALWPAKRTACGYAHRAWCICS